MPKRVVKTDDLDTAHVSLAKPEETDSKTRFARADMPLMQTHEMAYAYDGREMELLCNPEHADAVHRIDEALCTTISENSEAWFGQQITYDQIERMFRPTLLGSKNPRQVLKKAPTFSTFNVNNKTTDTFPGSGSGIFIIKVEGVKFGEKVCEAQWSVVQAKESLPSAPADSSPLFVA